MIVQRIIESRYKPGADDSSDLFPGCGNAGENIFILPDEEEDAPSKEFALLKNAMSRSREENDSLYGFDFFMDLGHFKGRNKQKLIKLFQQWISRNRKENPALDACVRQHALSIELTGIRSGAFCSFDTMWTAAEAMHKFAVVNSVYDGNMSFSAKLNMSFLEGKRTSWIIYEIDIYPFQRIRLGSENAAR